MILMHAQRQKRLWLIDRQAAAIGMEMRMDLGDWIKRRLKRGVNAQGAIAREALDRCGIGIQDLRHEWADQKKSQLSVHARTSV